MGRTVGKHICPRDSNYPILCWECTWLVFLNVYSDVFYSTYRSPPLWVGVTTHIQNVPVRWKSWWMCDYPYTQIHIWNIEYDTPQISGYERNSPACFVQWCLSIIVSTSRVALLLFNEIGNDVQVTTPTWEKKEVVTVFTCQHILDVPELYTNEA